MSDLNEWRLDYPGVSLDFGTLALDYPLAVQVDIGDTASDTQDQRHPTSDGVVFGKDSLGGFDLTFTMKTIPTFPPPSEAWNDALDLFSAFKSAWRADSIRRVPGAYASLTNVNRNKRVYGRPRKIGQKNNNLRRGLLEFLATFETNDPNFYDETEKLAIITPVPPASGGFTVPLTPPFSTAGSADEIAATVNEGDLAAWPVVKFHGPGRAFSLELLDGDGDTVWVIKHPDSIKFDEIVTVDTRPWARSATVNSKPANGRIRGTQLEKCQIPVGEFDFRFKVTDASGTAFADIRWRDAYASL